MLRLPGVAELRDRARLAERDEDRVETEALPTGGGRARSRREAHRCRRARHPPARARRARRRTARAIVLTRRARPSSFSTWRPSAQRAVSTPGRRRERHLDPRVVGEHPAIGRPDGAAVMRLDARVVGVRRAVLGRELVACEELQVPVGKQRPELRQLVRIRGADDRVQRRHFTPITKSASERRATSSSSASGISSCTIAPVDLVRTSI